MRQSHIEIDCATEADLENTVHRTTKPHSFEQLRPSPLLSLLLAALALLGCGGNDDDDGRTASTTAPNDACVDRQSLRRYASTVPSGYSNVLAWANAMTTTSSRPTVAKVEVDYIRLLEADSPTGDTTPVPDGSEEYTSNRAPLTVGEGALYDRTPRCLPVSSSLAISTSSVSGGVLTIDLAPAPNQYAHWWTPRATAKPGKRYFVESRFRVTGAAHIQFGIDYWRTASAPYNGYDETCVASNNCEGWISDWFGDTGGEFVMQRVPVL